MLRRWTTTTAVVAAIVLTGACAQQSEVGTTIEPGEADQEAVADTADVEATGLATTWRAIAAGESAVQAEIAIRDKEDGGTFASIALDGEEGRTYPWHVHEGDCGSGGSIVGDPAGYNAVTTDAGGEGRATADLAIDLSPEGDYYVNVHASPTDLETIVACGEVETR